MKDFEGSIDVVLSKSSSVGHSLYCDSKPAFFGFLTRYPSLFWNTGNYQIYNHFSCFLYHDHLCNMTVVSGVKMIHCLAGLLYIQNANSPEENHHVPMLLLSRCRDSTK